VTTEGGERPASLRAGWQGLAEARPVWVKAKGSPASPPSCRRSTDRRLKLQYVDCIADGAAERKRALDDYEPQTTTAEVRTLFAS
jgi:hypothetical protein